MKCYINHKFTTIAWGLVFIIILFCGCSNMIERLRAISDAELSVVLLCDNTNVANIEIPLGEAKSFSFIVRDKNTGEIIDNVYFLKDIQWWYPKAPLENSDTIEVSFSENKQTMTVKGVKATETPNEIYVTVNGVKSNVCAVTVKDPWEDIEVVIAYYEGFVKNFELALGKSTTLSVVLWDKNANELIDDISLYKNIQWQYPTSSKYISATVSPNKANLFLTGNNPTETPEEISVSVNGISSGPCMITVGKYYSVETPEDLKDVINKVETSGVTEIHISGNELVSSANSLIQIAQSLPERDGNKYTLDLSEATNIDLSTDFGNYPSDIEFFNSSVGEIILPEGLTTIGENALWGFTALERINIPSTVETIGNGALSGTKIREIVIPGSVRSIGNGAFDRCLQLSSISFENSSDGLKLGDDVFASCNSLAEITIPARITHLGDRSFFRCEKLSKITFESRESPIFVGELAFEKCPLSEVIIEDGKKDNITGAGADNLKKYIKDPTTP